MVLNLKAKIEKLQSLVKGKKILIAFSGGIDSTVVAFLSKEVAKEIICCTIYQNVYLKNGIIDAERIANELGIAWKKVIVDDIPDQFFLENPSNRCYICKKTLMHHLIEIKNQFGFDLIIDGTNYDDISEYRPGIRALKELGIVSPLAESEITKKEIRQIASNNKLSVAEKVSSPCLLTRIPFGDSISVIKLEMIKTAEDFLKTVLNVKVIRVRHYELNQKMHLARIELQKEFFEKIINDDDRILTKIVAELKKIGYNYVTLDLEGFRSGSMDIKISE